MRSTSKGEYLENLFKKDGFGKDSFSFVIVDDIEKVLFPRISWINYIFNLTNIVNCDMIYRRERSILL